MFLFELKADRIVPGVGHFGKPVGQSQDKENGGVAADRHAGFAFFNLQQRHAADGRALRSDFSGNAPPPPRIPYVMAKLAQGTGNGYREHYLRFLLTHEATSIYKFSN